MFQELFGEALTNNHALHEAVKALREHGMQREEITQVLKALAVDEELTEAIFAELEAAGIKEVPLTDFTFGGLLNLWVVILTDSLQDYSLTLSPEGRAVCHGVLSIHLQLDRLPPWIEGALAAVCVQKEVTLNDEEERSAFSVILDKVSGTVLSEFKSEAPDAQPVRDERDLRALIADATWEYAEETKLGDLVTEDN